MDSELIAEEASRGLDELTNAALGRWGLMVGGHETRAEARSRQDREDRRVKKAADDFQAKWLRVRDRLRTQLGEDLYSSWFARMQAERLDAGTVTLSVPTRFLRSWIKSRYGDKLLELWMIEEPSIKQLELRVRTHGEAARARRDGESAAVVASDPTNRDGDEGGEEDRTVAEIHAAAGQGPNDRGTPLDQRFTFETYVVGGSNALAHAAAQRVACGSPREPVEFNPLYIHGPVGMGKTHLMNAIAWEIRRRMPARRVLFLSAVRFMSSFVEAVKVRDTIAFKKLFADVDVLLIDDMQFLQGKAVQQEFCHVFNALDDAKHQVVIAGDLPPGRLDALDDRMRSRLSGGLVVQIGMADLEMRRGILEKRVSQMRSADPSVEIPDGVLEFLSRRVQGSGRELEGALNRVVAAHNLTKRPIAVESAAEAIRDLVNDSPARQVMIEDVLRAVSGHFNVTRQDLLSARRHKSVVFPRQIGMYLAKTLTTRSLPEIGRKFGGRDHTTVLHAVRKIERLLGEDPKVREWVDTLRNHLRE